MKTRLFLAALGLLAVFFCTYATAAGKSGSGKDYRIEPEDVIEITVYDESDLETKTRVSSEGEISFPLLGGLKVAGMTVSELKKMLEDKLAADYLVNPHVNVFIKEFNPRQIFVMGAVEKPGAYELPRDKKTSLLEIINQAGGFKTTAAINGTKIMRRDPKTGENKVIKVKVSDITEKGKKEEDVELQRDDVIVVPDSFF